MMKIIYRGLVLALTVIMLLSVTCPVAALAEMGVSDNSDTTETTESLETAVETKPIVEEPSTGKEEIIQEENPSGAGLEEIIEVDNNLELVPEAKAEESVEQEIIKTELPAGSTGPASNSTDNSNTQQKQEKTEAGIQAAGGTAEKAAAPSISTGNLSAADGSNKSTRTKTNAELFIDAKGSDEAGNGSFEAPFATLEAALNAAKGMGVDAELCLLSNLSVTSAVQILGMNVYLTSNEGACTITRDDAFDLGEGGINTAMFAIGSPAEDSPGGQLILEHVVLNEKGMKTEPVQDGMISVYSGGKLILGEEAALLNYGGESAVYACAGSEVSVSATGWILNDMPFEEDGTVAIREEEGSTVIREAGCIVLSHGQTWEEVYSQIKEENGEDDQFGETNGLLPATGNPNAGNKDENILDIEEDADSANDGDGEGVDRKAENADEEFGNKTAGADTDGENKKETGSGPTLETKPILKVQKNSSEKANISSIELSKVVFDAPDSISRDDDHDHETPLLTENTSKIGYLVQYQFVFTPGSLVREIIGNVDSANSVSLNLAVSLDGRLYPEIKVVDGVKIINFVPGEGVTVESASYQGNDIIVVIKTNDVEALINSGSLSLSLNTIFPYDSFPVSDMITDDNKMIISSAKAESIAVNDGEAHSLDNLNVTAETELLKDNYATLIYDPNKGTGGPGTKRFSEAQENYLLDQINAPSHTDVGIANETYHVVFYSWTKTPDTNIYTSGDDPLPPIVSSISIDLGEEVTVYAVYSYDKNNDGIPDARQRFVTLSYDADGGIGAPDAETKLLLGTKETFKIPSTEPSKKYFIFKGWNDNPGTTIGKYRYNNTSSQENEIRIGEDTTIYAAWEETPVYTLYFNGNGGSNVPAAQSARSDNGVAEMTITRQIPTRSGRTFVGWSVQRYGTAAFDPGEDVRLTGGDVTLFAVWERNGSSSGRAPKTGDESNVPLYVVLAVGSAAAAYGIIHVLKKRRK